MEVSSLGADENLYLWIPDWCPYALVYITLLWFHQKNFFGGTDPACDIEWVDINSLVMIV